MAITARAVEGVKVDNKELRTAISAYASVTKKALADVIREQARLMCRDLVDFYPPFEAKKSGAQQVGGGFTLKARDKGRDAVSRDVRKIFAPLPQAQAGSVAQYGSASIFAKWVDDKLKLPGPHYPNYVFDGIQKGKHGYLAAGWMAAESQWNYFKQVESGAKSRKAKFFLTPSMATIEAIHKKRRGSPNYRVSETQTSEKVYVDDFKVVLKYIKKVQQRVGKLKAGWWWTGKFLGKMRRADWISDQGSSTAICRPMLNGEKPGVVIGNTIARSHSSGWHLFSLARNYRHFALRNQIIQTLKGKRNNERLLDAARRIKGIQISTQE